MTTIEEIENEIAALKEALEIIEERTGDKIYTSELKLKIQYLINAGEELRLKWVMDLPVHPYEPEFEKD